jgi:peptidoglycan hydrolase FlgJ
LGTLSWLLRGAGFVSIKPPSDIVFDVARAVDPARSVEATERLARMAARSDAADAGFSNALGDVPRTPQAPADLGTHLEFNSVAAHARMTESLDPQTKAYRSFEALMLQNLVETMLPNSEEFFGEGTAGVIWKSMLAQQLGEELAKKVDLGLGPKHTYKPHAVHHAGAALREPNPAASVVPPVGVTLRSRS